MTEFIDTGLSKLSIRLRPDGLSFSDGKTAWDAAPEEALARADSGEVLLEILTDRMVLVPLEAYVPECKERYFEAGAIGLSPGERIVEIECPEGVALAAVDGGVMDTIASRYGNVRMTCPFSQPAPTSTEIDITAAGSCSFVTLFSGGRLLCAEALPVADFPSLLFFVNRLIVSRKMGKVRIVCKGDGAASLADNFSDYYSDTACE